MFQVRLEFPGEFLLIVLLKLLSDRRNDLRDLIILITPELRVNFLVAVMPGVQVDEAFQSRIVVILELIVCSLALPHVGHLFDHVRHDICDRSIVAF